MRVDQKVSADVVERRKHMALGVFAGVLATLLGVLGVQISRTGTAQDQDRDLVYLVSTALDRGQAYWTDHVPGYRRAHVVLYEQSTATACGVGLTASGPFYCPGDEQIYVDLSFLRAINGDLARAYVIEHELGHHIQKLRNELDRADSIHTELEADCYAGELMRAEQRAGNLGPGDIPAAIAEAAAVGDDRLCPGCSPESWSHGSSAMRAGQVQAGIAGAGCHL